MTILQSVILGIIEGITEFLPVSSTAHLIVFQKLFGIQEISTFFTTVVQLGALGGLVVAESKTLLFLAQSFVATLQKVVKKEQPLNALTTDRAFMLMIATAPVIVGGLLLSSVIETIQNTMVLIASMSIFVAFVLWIAEKKSQSTEHPVRLSQIILMGIAQVIAFIPGTSRSGIVAASGMMQGLTRSQALEYSFLLSIPSLSLAGGYELLSLLNESIPQELVIATVYATIAAFVSSLFVVNALRSLVRNYGFVPFVVYRIVFGIVILSFFV